MIRLLLACALALLPLPALAQEGPPGGPGPPAGQTWRQADGRLFFTPAAVSLPDRAGAAAMTETREFSHRGQHMDNVVQYRSSDGELIVTAYIYYPGLAHVGLAAFATDHAIRLSSESEVRTMGTRIVAAGGHPGTALRTDYGNYRNGNASSAAFIKLDRWLIKLRVTAPERRRADVDAAMSALLDGIRFEGEAPRPAAPLETSDCRADGSRDAQLLASDPTRILLDALVAIADGGGMTTRPRDGGAAESLPSRVPASWCVSRRARIGDGRVPILRASGDAAAADQRSRLVAILTDSGGLVEVVEVEEPARFLLLHHQIGETALLGSFDAVPSDDQIVALLEGRDRAAARIRARARLTPGEGADLELSAEDMATPAGPTT
jgi:hypothetical protein